MDDRIKAGDTLYEINRYSDPPKVDSRQVDKVGRKYAYVDDVQYHLDILEDTGAYGPRRRLYRSRQEAVDLLDTTRILDKVRDAFHGFAAWRSNTPSVDKLRRIEAILDEGAMPAPNEPTPGLRGGG